VCTVEIMIANRGKNGPETISADYRKERRFWEP
jgi:hypothetical protein